MASGCRPSPLVVESAFPVAALLAAPAARVSGSAAFLAAPAAFFGVLARVGRAALFFAADFFAADFFAADFRAAVEDPPEALFDVVGDFFLGAMKCRYPPVAWL